MKTLSDRHNSLCSLLVCLCEVNPDIDGRSHGVKRRNEAAQETPKAMLSMLERHSALIKEGSYVVFDGVFVLFQTALL